MVQKQITSLKMSSPYTAAITREQFLFYEMRTTARLLIEGLSDEEVANRIISENLFQYPTEKSVRKMALACIRRLHYMSDDTLICAIANQPSDVAKQICLYAMMKQYRLVSEFMVSVVGEKYRLRDFSFSRMDLNIFFVRLQEQDDWVASWSDSTVVKVKQVLNKLLIENGYIDSYDSDHLNPVWLSPLLENAIRSNNDDLFLPAFNYFS